MSQRASLLGYGLTLGLLLSLLGTTDWSSTFGLYVSILSLFHFSEYVITSIINPRSLSLDSFLLNHSKEYGLAALLAVIEFTLESHFWPQLKSVSALKTFGLILCISGETIRKLAMITAGSNFNHIVQSRREEGHELVTHGIYSLCRHPSYVGWFLWSVGTQVIVSRSEPCFNPMSPQVVLLNPICCVGYAIAGWKFFKERIFEEEITLLNFFGEDYLKYKQRVRSGLPFIYGYRLED